MTKRKIIRRIVLWIGICLCAYPLIANVMEQKKQSKTISTYENELREYEKNELSKMLEAAEKYNDVLYQSKSLIGSSAQVEILNHENYEKLLSVSKTTIMGIINIPQIEVKLPIYHGTGSEVLSKGVGHLEGSSLPVGGKNAHCVLTGHRGLPNSKLFTRLDELEKGDLFYVEVADKIMAYCVKEIQVISPEDVNCLSIKEGNDFVSLVTCTPYGINSHRLVVTGERVAYREKEYVKLEPRTASKREVLFTVLPFVMVGIVTVKFSKERRERKRGKK